MDKRSAAEGRERGRSSQTAFKRLHRAGIPLADPEDVKPPTMMMNVWDYIANDPRPLECADSCEMP
jgi:hypothetical protein